MFNKLVHSRVNVVEEAKALFLTHPPRNPYIIRNIGGL